MNLYMEVLMGCMILLGGWGIMAATLFSLESAKIFIISSLLVCERLNLDQKKIYLQMFSNCLV